MSWLPNAITLLRVLLVIPTAMLLWRGEYNWALVLMIAAGVSDGLDGYLARRYNWFSQFGAVVDPLADKFLVATMLLVFALQDYFPWWFLAIIVLRDALIFTGGVIYLLLFGPFEMAPSLLSKANTAAQIVVVVIAIVALCDFGELSQFCQQVVTPWGIWILAVLGIASGVHYVSVWGYRTMTQLRERRLS